MSDYSDRVIADGGADLIGYYRFAEAQTNGATCTDSSGSGNSGVYNGDCVYGGSLIEDVGDGSCLMATTGRVNLFNGATGKLSAALAGAAGVTAECWLSIGANVGYVYNPFHIALTNSVADANAACGLALGLNAEGPTITAQARSTSGDSLQTATATFALSTISHVAVVADFANDRLKIFLDGVLRTNQAVTFGAATWTAANNAIGDSFGVGWAGRYVQGAADEFAFYKRALTDAEIGNHYYIGKKWRDRGVLKPRSVKGYSSPHHLGL